MTKCETGTPPEVALRVADQLIDGPPESQARALELYTIHARSIDPATPEGSGRLGWVLHRPGYLATEFEPVVRLAIDSAFDSWVREQADVLWFQFPLRRGDAAAAEAHLRGVHAKLRGKGSVREVGVANNLAHIYRRQAREHETLAFARLAARLAARHDAVLGNCIAQSSLIWAWARLGEREELEAAAARLSALSPELPPDHVGHAERNIRVATAEIRFLRADPATALADLDELVAETVDPDAWFDLEVLRTRALCALGRRVEAAANAAQLAASPPGSGSRRLEVVACQIRCLCNARLRGEARDLAVRFSAALSGPEVMSRSAAVVAQACGTIAEALSPDSVALPFCEAAAAATVARMSELERFVADLRDLVEVEPGDAERLARHRQRSLDEHRSLLAAFARIWDARGGAPPLLASFATDGRLHVCAWCLELLLPDGRQLPIGHLIPESPPGVLVTHGICDRCHARAR